MKHCFHSWIRKARNKTWMFNKGVIYLGQSAESYKQKSVDVATPLIHEQVPEKYKERLIPEPIVCFSMITWMQGCPVPRVEHYTASLRMKPDAQPKIQQPLRLSAFNQRHLEFHEGLDVAGAKAYRAEPGGHFCWGPPSFVIDQDGKGVSGRPARDYR